VVIINHFIYNNIIEEITENISLFKFINKLVKTNDSKIIIYMVQKKEEQYMIKE
jgi:hypothetical protein